MNLPAVPTHPTRPSVAHEEQNADSALDWLFARGNNVRTVLAATINGSCALSTDNDDETQVLAVVPSDHMPVMAVYRVS